MPVTINGSNTPTAGGVTYGNGTQYATTAAGTSGQLLQSNGASAPSWVAAPTTSPAGSNTQIQYNNSGAFGASSALTFDGTNLAVTQSGNPTMTVKTTGSGNNPLYRLQADTNYWDALGVFSDANDTLRFRYNGTDYLTLTNAGAIGVGSGLSYGTSGQVLTSGGSGAAPTWSTPSSGAVVLISTATASASASIAFTGLTTTYAYYFIEFDSLYNSSAGVTFQMYVSSDNGSTYKGSGQYKTLNYYNAFASNGTISDSTGNQFYIAAQGNGMSGNVAFSASGIVYVYSPAANSCTFTWTTMNQTSTELDSQWGAGTLVTKAAVNAIKFQSSSGNITGNFRLYGVVKT